MFISPIALSTVVLLTFGGWCHGLALADDAIVVKQFAPVGMYAGHWGIDLEVAPGSDVRSVGSGIVSFAGSVAGTRSVTVDHGGGIRTSYSYLVTAIVTKGQTVDRGTAVGSSGVHDGRAAFHLSLRSGSTYLDPMILERCSTVPGPALWLTMAFDG